MNDVLKPGSEYASSQLVFRSSQNSVDIRLASTNERVAIYNRNITESEADIYANGFDIGFIHGAVTGRQLLSKEIVGRLGLTL